MKLSPGSMRVLRPVIGLVVLFVGAELFTPAEIVNPAFLPYFSTVLLTMASLLTDPAFINQDCLGPAADAEATLAGLGALRRGGVLVLTGGVAQDLPAHSRRLQFNQHSIIGSLLFTPAELSEVIAMIDAGLVDLSLFLTESFLLDQINDGLQAVKDRPSGLANYIVVP